MPVAKFGAVPPVVNEETAFAPLNALVNAIRYWWVIFILMVIGGLAGWMIHTARPPVYEAAAHLSASIDFVSTGPLTQYEEDVALNAVGDFINSEIVIQQVIERAAAQGIQIDRLQLIRNSSVERKLTTWDLRVREPDPEKAEQIANLWVEAAHSVLLESHQHALEAERLNRYLRSLEDCLAQTSASQQVSVPCGPGSLSEIQAEFHSAGGLYDQERLASQGIFYGLTIGPADKAELFAGPVQYDRNQVVLAGCLIGLLMGAGLVQLGLPARWMKRD